MFLLLSVRHVGAHPGEHQHGVSIQISISLGKTFLRISRIRNIPVTWILARVFVHVPPFISQILRLYLLNGFDFYFDLFWMAWHWKRAIIKEGTPNNGRYGEAPPERGSFFRLQVYERVGISLFEVYESIITLIDCSQSTFFRKIIEIERSWSPSVAAIL